jgi:hypothetical protein
VRLGAFVAALAAVTALSGCGRPLPPATHTDTEYRFALRYDDSMFEKGPLALAPLLDRAHRAAGYEPVVAVSFVESGAPPTTGDGVNGFSIAVFPLPPEVRSLGIWRLGDQVVPSMMENVRAAVPEAAIADLERVEYRGMKGYGTTLRVQAEGGPYQVWLFVLVRDPFAYEIVMQARETDVERLRSEFADVLWTLRTGADLTIE